MKSNRQLAFETARADALAGRPIRTPVESLVLAHAEGLEAAAPTIADQLTPAQALSLCEVYGLVLHGSTPSALASLERLGLIEWRDVTDWHGGTQRVRRCTDLGRYVAIVFEERERL